MIFAPFVENAERRAAAHPEHGRKIPHVDIDAQPAFTCTVVPVPESEHLGAQFLVRFNVDGIPVVTVRQKDVEKVYCPSPEPGKAMLARLDRAATRPRSTPSRWTGSAAPWAPSSPRSGDPGDAPPRGRGGRAAWPACSPPGRCSTTTTGSRSSTATTCPAAPSRGAASRRAGTPTACWPGPEHPRGAVPRPDRRPGRSRRAARRRRAGRASGASRREPLARRDERAAAAAGQPAAARVVRAGAARCQPGGSRPCARTPRCSTWPSPATTPGWWA